VENQCTKVNGEVKKVIGKAKPVGEVVERNGDLCVEPAILKVSFFAFFYGPYWILALDDDYQWVMVGSPDRKYLWILSRTPELSESILDMLTEKARNANYPVQKLLYTKESV
jgi:lipocalin